MRMFKMSIGVAGLLGSAVVLSFSVSSAQPDEKRATQPDVRKTESFSPFVDQDGIISLPKNYRNRWAHLGDWAIAKKEGEPVYQFHTVYTQPDVVEEYKKTGKFPDGAVLVKEIRHANVKKLNTGQAAWSTDIDHWFVMIKDHKGRFKDNPNWGKGWGWGLFEAKDPAKNVSTNYRRDCIGCHLPVKKTDWVYVYGYPDLQSKLGLESPERPSPDLQPPDLQPNDE